MPEFPRLKNRSGQVEWDGGSIVDVGISLTVLFPTWDQKSKPQKFLLGWSSGRSVRCDLSGLGILATAAYI